jgi:hypothetical protein
VNDAARNAETIGRVMLEVENRESIGGAPLFLVRDEATNKHALAIQIGNDWRLRSKWIDVEKAITIAYRVAGGDSRAITHPGVLQAFAIVLLSAAVAAEEMNNKTQGGDAAIPPKPILDTSAMSTGAGAARDAAPAPRGQGMLQLDAARATAKDEARARGYTGDVCIMCGNFTMKRNGTCLVCETCGANSGCG